MRSSSTIPSKLWFETFFRHFMNNSFKNYSGKYLWVLFGNFFEISSTFFSEFFGNSFGNSFENYTSTLLKISSDIPFESFSNSFINFSGIVLEKPLENNFLFFPSILLGISFKIISAYSLKGPLEIPLSSCENIFKKMSTNS